MLIQPVKGTRDFYPANLAFRNWLGNKMRKSSELFGYIEWDGPMLEPFELYAAKSGDELVNEQAFVLEDRGGKKIVMRPELTPSLARLVAQKQQELGRPLRWFSWGPMWRYEQPQRGRAREFWQWNVDMLGVNAPEADAELIAVAISFLTSLGLDENDFVVKINDRMWFKQICNSLRLEEKYMGKILHAVDRIDKMPKDKWIAYLESIGLTPQQVSDLYDKVEASKDFDINNLDASTSLPIVFRTLANMGLKRFIQADVSVVRGLDYYTATVFEIRDRKGVLRAIGGGGRYENLVEQVGGTPLSAAGFALGDMPLEELLKEVDKYPTAISNRPDVLVTVFGPEYWDNSLTIANQLRSSGIKTELYITDRAATIGLDKQLKYADHKGIPYAIIVGQEEVASATAVLKDLADHSQVTVPIAELIETIKGLGASV